MDMSAKVPGRRFAGSIVRPVVRVRTYRVLAYLLVSIPLALVYWMVLGMGLMVGLVLTVVLVGIPILVGMIVLTRGFASLERWLANRLLALDLERPDDVREADGPLGSVRAYLDAPSTWRDLAFVTLRFWVALVAVLIVAVGVQALQLVSTLVVRPTTVTFGEINGEPVTWTVNSTPEAVLAAIAGGMLVLVVAHLLGGVGYVVARMAEGLLG